MTKAVSPLLASVLLVAVTVGIGTLTAGFVSTTFRSAESTVTNRTAEASDCSSAEIVIDDAFAKTGDNGTVAVPVRNSGFSDLQIISAQLYDRLGNNFSASNMPIAGFSKGSIVNLNFQMPKLANTTADSSSYGNNGNCTAMGAGDKNNTCSFTLSGKSGSAMSFDGVNDFVNVSNSASLNSTTTALTIVGWMYANSLTSDPVVVNKRYQDSYYLQLLSNGSIEFGSIWNATNSATWIKSGVSKVSAGQWYHVAATFDTATDTAVIYSNGVIAATDTDKTGNIGLNTLPLLIGQNHNGTIDDVAIWNRTLTGTEINTSMLSGPLAVSNTNDLLGYWKFDEGRGILACSDFSQILVTTSCGGISAAFDRMPRCS